MGKIRCRKGFAMLMAALVALLSVLGGHEAKAATTLVSDMEGLEAGPTASRSDSFKIAKTGDLKITVTGSGDCKISLYYAGADWDSAGSGMGDLLEEKEISLSSSNQSFTVSATKKGVYNLQVTAKLDWVSCDAKVYLVTGAKFKLNKTTASLKAGKTLQLTASGATGKVAWSSSNSKVAKVTSSGKVTAVKAGSAVITAKCNGKTATCKLTVTGPSPKLNIKKVTITEGEEIQLKVTNSTGKVEWSSDNIYVAQVSSKGLVTGISRGTATVKATCNGITLTCSVTVEE